MGNLIKTNTNIYKERIFKAILESINFENEGVDLELTDRQKLDYFFNDFNSWSKGYEEKRTPNNQQRLAGYLMGLPTSLPSEYVEILEFAKELHGAKELTEKEENTIIEKYWSHMALFFIRLNEKLTK